MKQVPPPQPHTSMSYGYYSPLTDLEENSYVPLPGAQESHPQPSTPIQSAHSAKTLSFYGLKTTLKYTAAAASALSVGLFIYNLSQNPDGFPQDAKPENPSAFPATQTAYNELHTKSIALISTQGLAQALSKTGSDLVEIATNPTQALVEAGQAAHRYALAAFYNLNVPLERTFITEADKVALKVREEHPSFFATNFAQDVLGDSAVGTAIRLAAAQGETSTPIAQHAACANLAQYDLSLLSSPEKIKGLLGKKMTKEEFVAKQEQFYGYKEGEYEAYLAKYEEKERCFDQITANFNPEIYEQLSQAHFSAVNATSSFVARNFMFATPSAPQDSWELALYSKGNVPDNYICRVEHGRGGKHHTKARFCLEEWKNSGESDLVLKRYVVGHTKGKSNSSWEKYAIGCSYIPESETVHCSSNDLKTPVDHPYGNLHYNLAEKMVTKNCSMVTEYIKTPLAETSQTYAINPKNELPVFFSSLINNERFSSKHKETLWARMTGEVDAVAALSLQFPKMPRTCQELEAIENPKPRLETPGNASAAAKPTPPSKPQEIA